MTLGTETRIPLPKASFEDSSVPELARKEMLLGTVVSYDDIKRLISNTNFTSRTKNTLDILASMASSRELLMANHWGGTEKNNRANFMCWLIEQEAMLPREDRRTTEYVNIDRAIKTLFDFNITQSVQDKRGYNVFRNQYSDVKEQYATVSDYRDELAAQQQQQPHRRFTLRGALGAVVGRR